MTVPLSPDLEVLRLHVAAVWDVRLPFLAPGDVDMLPGGVPPPWALYLAATATGRVRIWRPDLDGTTRATLAVRAEEALALPVAAPVAEVSREVVLHQTAPPTMGVAAAGHLARAITESDRALIEAFEPGEAAYYLDPGRAPIFGVVAAGRLLSVAHSSRRTAEACELGVETRPEARRRGYALAVTVLWADAVAAEGRIPLYSALAENTASLALAAAAGYRVVARAAYVKPSLACRPCSAEPRRGEPSPA